MLRKLFMTLAVAGCVTAPDLPRIDYQYVDIPEEKRVVLTYRNSGEKAVCLTADDWPNSRGELDSMSGRVFLRIGEERFSIKNIATAYCPRGCWTRVDPGEEISGFLPYEHFDLPERLINEPKVLEFDPQAEYCH